MSHRFKEPVKGNLRCPWCGRVEKGAGTVDLCRPPRAPQVGDFSVCGGCTSVLIFIEHPTGLAFRKATMQDIAPLDESMKQAIINTVLFTRGKITQVQYEHAKNN